MLLSDIAEMVIKEPAKEGIMTVDQFENLKEDDMFTGRRKKFKM